MNPGGGLFDIVPEMDDPIEISFSGVEDPLYLGRDMTVTATMVPDSATYSYQWHLQGAPLPGEPGARLPSKELPLGTYWLNLVVTGGSVLSSRGSRVRDYSVGRKLRTTRSAPADLGP